MNSLSASKVTSIVFVPSLGFVKFQTSTLGVPVPPNAIVPSSENSSDPFQVIVDALANVSNNASYGEWIKINATVTDNEGISNVTIQVDPPGANPYNVTPIRLLNEFYNDTVNLTDTGQWEFIFHANDTSTNNATPVTLQDLGTESIVNVTDVQGPTILDALANVTNNASYGEWIKINATITDANNNLENVTIQVDPPGANPYNVTAIQLIDEFYNDTVNLTESGQWEFIFHSNDTTGLNATPLTLQDLGGESIVNVSGQNDTSGQSSY